MVHLVLDTDGVEVFGPLIDGVAVVIEIPDAAAGRALDLVENVRHREAAFFVGLRFFHRFEDFRVHEIARLLFFPLAGEIHHDDAQRHADLDRGEADAGRVIHGFQHVIHQRAVLVGDGPLDGL